MAQRGYDTYEILYFAFHGVRGSIKVGRGTVPLLELADKLQGKAARLVYFGACKVMSDARAVEEFLKRTGAKAVCGHTRDVDWTESAAFDLLLLSSPLGSQRIDARFNFVRDAYPDLVKRLGFVSYPSFIRRTT